MYFTTAAIQIVVKCPAMLDHHYYRDYRNENKINLIKSPFKFLLVHACLSFCTTLLASSGPGVLIAERCVAANYNVGKLRFC